MDTISVMSEKSSVPSNSELTELESREDYFTVYILRTSSNTLYIGQTNNLEKRLKEHKEHKSKSAKYIRYFNSFKLVYTEEYQTRTEAMRRELQLKQWSRVKKEALIAGCNPELVEEKRSTSKKVIIPSEVLSAVEG